MRYPSLALLLLCTSPAVRGAESAAATPTASPAPATAPANASSAAPNISDGAVFNGQDLTGWKFVAPGSPALDTVATVKDGVIIVVGRPNGFLEIPGARSNYTLHVEWRWPGTPGNGGVLLHMAPGIVQQNLWPRCFQVQLKTQRGGDVLPMGGAKFAEPPTPQPNPTAAVQKDRVAGASEKPAGEWNSADIVCRGSTIEVSINGVAQNKVTGCDPASGGIGFQLEGAPFELRNLKFTPLPSSAP